MSKSKIRKEVFRLQAKMIQWLDFYLKITLFILYQEIVHFKDKNKLVCLNIVYLVHGLILEIFIFH